MALPMVPTCPLSKQSLLGGLAQAIFSDFHFNNSLIPSTSFPLYIATAQVKQYSIAHDQTLFYRAFIACIVSTCIYKGSGVILIGKLFRHL